MRLKWTVLAKSVSLAVFTGVSSIVVILIANFYVDHLTPVYVIRRPKSDEDGNVQHFAQISDLHLSVGAPERLEDFGLFMAFAKAKIRPSALLVTGDVTEAKNPDNVYDSHQIESEWIAYANVVSRYKASFPILDIRGNHDAFGVDQVNNDFFANFSVSGASRSYAETVGDLTFVGVDMTPSPGFRQPYNFMGYFGLDEEKRLVDVLSSNPRPNLFFGHYPLSLVETESGVDLTEKIQGVYLCGHLHTLYGSARRMWTRKSSGVLEVELGDWKIERRFRIGAFQNGRDFTFVDATFEANGDNFVVLVTKPEQRLFETLLESPSSTVIEALIFSSLDIAKIEASIDGGRTYATLTRKSELKFATEAAFSEPWTILFKATFIDGRVAFQEWSAFPIPSVISGLVLMSDWTVISRFVFYGLLGVTLSILGFCRAFKRQIRCRFFRGLALFSADDGLFYATVAFILYLAFMPWTLGYVLEKRLGVVFAWGVLMTDTWEKTCGANMTYVYGFFAVLTLLWPTLATTSQVALKRLDGHAIDLKLKVGMILAALAQFRHIVVQGLTYGVLAAFSPFGVGWALFGAFCANRVL